MLHENGVLQSIIAITYGCRLFVRIRNYENPTNKCPQCHNNPLLPVGCCDNFEELGECTGRERCDDVFHFCLRQLGNRQNTFCGQIISQANINGRPLDFTRGALLGLRNPVRFRRRGGWVVSYMRHTNAPPIA